MDQVLSKTWSLELKRIQNFTAKFQFFGLASVKFKIHSFLCLVKI